jgi:zinc protease
MHGSLSNQRLSDPDQLQGGAMTVMSIGVQGALRALLGRGISVGLCVLVLITAQLFIPPAHAMKIQEITSPSGLKAWLVEEHSVPLVAMRFAFDGGNAQDPQGQEGLTNFLSGMLDEGAGDLSATQFQQRMEEIAMRMSFDDSRDAFFGSFETLTENRDQAVELLRLALHKPRFDAEAIERVRGQLLAGLAYAARDPEKVAAEQWDAIAFSGHPYGRPTNGTATSLQQISRDDLEGYRRRVFAKDNLRVVIVGDIDANSAGAMLDAVFGELAPKAELIPVADVVANAQEKLKVVEMNVPQSVARFGLSAMSRKDNDFMAAFTLNQILGGGGFASRLMEEVREKRGLAYSVYSYLLPMTHASVWSGGVATKNEKIDHSLALIRAELKRMSEFGPTQKELDNARSYLIGSFALRFDTNSKIASQLLWIYQEDLGIDYIEKRNAMIDALTIDDVKRVANRLLNVDNLIVTVVGKPKMPPSRS